MIQCHEKSAETDKTIQDLRFRRIFQSEFEFCERSDIKEIQSFITQFVVRLLHERKSLVL